VKERPGKLGWSSATGSKSKLSDPIFKPRSHPSSFLARFLLVPRSFCCVSLSGMDCSSICSASGSISCTVASVTLISKTWED